VALGARRVGNRNARRYLVLVALALFALSTIARVEAQFPQRGSSRGFLNVRTASDKDFDGRFNFCRVAFTSDFRGDGASWSVDYPRADINLSIRLSELTKTTISRDPAGEPRPLLVQLTDPALFRCPFIMMTEVGGAVLTSEEATQLRLYLEKGGFLWADDFWGSFAWEWWEGQLRRALPADEYAIVDLPPGHPLFHALFEVKQTPQIPSIGFWAGSGGATSERGADSATVHTRAVLDRHGRIMVLMTHNTDVGDSFEREADDPQYFYQMSVPGYAFGINALLYAMTH
jgi:Domain of unknown function (DUF4159)